MPRCRPRWHWSRRCCSAFTAPPTGRRGSAPSSRSASPGSKESRLMGELDGRAAIVSGAAQGIGRACALALARAGAGVTVADVDAELGPKTVAELEGLGVRALF